MPFALTDCRLFLGSRWTDLISLIIDGGVITELRKTAELPDGIERVSLGGKILMPGFIDVQVNGGGGVLFNDEPTVDGIKKIAAAHRKFGTTGLLPTLISDDLAVVDKAMRAVEQAIEEGVPGILGIHIEGPFLNAVKKGVHDAGKFRAIDEDAFKLLTSLKRGITHVTIAPEKTTPEMIKRLTDAGVILSAGHTGATYEETSAALQAGVRGFTHLYNAMTGLESRAPGVVGAALESRTAFAGIIVDGFHVHKAALNVALHAKGTDHLMLVTDAMPSVGAKDKNFTLQGRAVTVTGGRCTAPDGTLAGSDLDMASAVRNTHRMLGLPVEAAAKMASASPAAFLKIDREVGHIRAGQRADLVALDDDITVQQVWIGGTPFGAEK
ncbi:N-acetylglucosamine-6-phosphate deacetylase [Kordiimonas gwangyangensis]|uniref:N-acetylglucosamine-6-phosphate deacetylase n=1 Tax=Kordiimonas gwangyangensis TaxID=288022 RepID=UPI00037ECE70|nr:N-acetylglucosamine-6-phosphate deacetylase [Kordiimonas gwangyangensis]